jgi:hypothetical protein
MIKYKVTHKITKETRTVWAKDKESALQIFCSESNFVGCDKNSSGWWDRKDVDIIEAN